MFLKVLSEEKSTPNHCQIEKPHCSVPQVRMELAAAAAAAAATLHLTRSYTQHHSQVCTTGPHPTFPKLLKVTDSAPNTIGLPNGLP